MTALLLGGIYLFLLPFVWVWAHGGTGGLEPGPSLPLFGDTRLWVVCLLLVLPLSIALAPGRRAHSWKESAFTVAIGMVLPWLLFEGLQSTEALWSFTGADRALRWIGRPLVAWILLWPWTFFARRSGIQIPNDLPMLLTCILLAFLPTGLYSLRLAQLQREKLQGQMDRNLVVPVLESIGILAQVSGWDNEAAKRYAVDRLRLKQEAQQLIRRASKPISDDAPAPQKWELAIAWVRLGLPDRAQTVLDALAHSDPVAGLFSASLDRFEGRWDKAQIRYLELLERPQGTFTCNDRYTIYEGLAESLQGQGRFAQLSALWQRALIEFPQKAGSIHFNLAMAEASMGRYRSALSDLDAALAASPGLKEQVEKQRRRILTNTSACFSRFD